MAEPRKFRVEVCFSPEEFDLYKQEYKAVVAIDVLRATTAICTAFQHGAEKLIPVSTIEEAREYQGKGFLVGAERNGQIVEGFDFGNSPYSYMGDFVKGKTLVLSTTNGTKAINRAAKSHDVYIGALVNLDAIIKQFIDHPTDVLLLASGWQGKFNLEDSICAGAITEALINSRKYMSDEDSTIASLFLFQKARDNYFGFLKASSHRRRLRNLNLNEDIKYCLTPNQTDVIPVYREGALVNLAS
ncbi:MAG: 2-phosphosulfolactate phosphatase [Cryomorphaceae bacterium]|nr:2-phosphosulfolactate phosphatase [Flavobacteriales bacterium]